MTKYWLAAFGVTLGLTAARGAFGHDCPDGVARGGLGTDSFERTDADRDGQVTLVEARAFAMKLFDGLDLDRDGTVGRVEAKRGAGLWREQRFEQRFVELDSDRDGVLALEETGMLQHRFGRFDGNADQRLTRAELKRVYLPRAGGERGAALSARFMRWDMNRDGNVTQTEAQQAADLQFARKDRDGNRVITRREAHIGSPRRRPTGSTSAKPSLY